MLNLGNDTTKYKPLADSWYFIYILSVKVCDICTTFSGLPLLTSIQYLSSVSGRQCRPPAGALLISWLSDTNSHWSRSAQTDPHWSALFTSVRVPLVAYYSEFILIQRPA